LESRLKHLHQIGIQVKRPSVNGAYSTLSGKLFPAVVEKRVELMTTLSKCQTSSHHYHHQSQQVYAYSPTTFPIDVSTFFLNVHTKSTLAV